MNLFITFFRSRRKPAFGLNLIAFGLGLAVSAQAQVSPGAAEPRYPRPLGLGPRLGPSYPVFFPPAPPPLGTLPEIADPGDLRPVPPAELAPFAYEAFYAPLSACLASPDPRDWLTDRQKQQVEAYRASKAALQAELLARLYTLREVDASSRLQDLQSFAREQTPRLVELEKTAEQLRLDLIGRGNGESGIGPVIHDKFIMTAEEMKAAVFYGRGLSPAQRRLLREMVLETPDGAPVKTPPGPDGGWLFFTPDTARVQLPPGLPAELAAKVSAYERTKNALKIELRAAISESGGSGSTDARVQELAVRQEPQFVGLESLAEDIRRRLQGLIADPLRAPRLPLLPPELEERIAAYRKAKLDLQKALLARVQGITGQAPAADSAAMQEKVQQAIALFTRENAPRYAGLEKAKEEIRRDLAHVAAASPSGAGNDQSSDRLLRNFTDSLQQHELWRLYYEYRIAVFEPGLSPEQRRLLFANAVERLALPPPSGASQPR